MNVLITRLRLGPGHDTIAAKIMKEGSAYDLCVCDDYVKAIRNRIPQQKPLHVVMSDGLFKAYWHEFGHYFEATPLHGNGPPTPQPTELKLYDVYIGPSPMGSHRLVMLSESESAGEATLRWKFGELTSKVKVELTEIVGPFKSGFILCKVDNGGRQEFNGIYREARD